jgi:hypothetical protein
MNQTRPLAAILAADVVGYSRLMDGDNGEIWRCGKPDEATPKAFSHRGALCEWGCLSSWLDPTSDDVNIRWTSGAA